MNDHSGSFIYRATRKECLGKSLNWVKGAINEVMSDLTAQIDREGKVPELEQIERIEAVLQALKDELKLRGVSI